MAEPQTLLVCTIGGSPEPAAAALRHWKPSRVLFVVSPQTRGQVEGRVLPLAAEEPGGVRPGPGSYEFVDVTDAQDFTGCVRALRRLGEEVDRWLGRGEGYRVVVDFTGGTKCMTAALALQAHPWGCLFSYVGGQERTKDSVGVVVSGTEQVLHAHNPWAALGYRAVADAVVLFDQGAYGAAGRLLQEALRQVHDPARKRELATLKTVADAYDAWDRFEHGTAARLLGDAARGENDLRVLFGPDRAARLRSALERDRGWVAELARRKEPNREVVADLLANARRCGAAGRFDDGVARLYRALEALAQAALRERHGVADTGHVPLDSLPEGLRAAKAGQAQEGEVWLGLQDAYAWLRERGDGLGECFHRRRLDDPEKSNLQARNASILAHGFAPVGGKVFANLWADALELAREAGVSESHLPEFPRLGPEG
jgi:CRISPR-associated protein (TIGR02710 family)